MIWGVIMVVFGVVVWLLNFTGRGWDWGRDWPFIVILIGIYEISKHMRYQQKKKDRSLKKILKDVESGKLKAEDALKKMEKEDEE